MGPDQQGSGGRPSPRPASCRRPPPGVGHPGRCRHGGHHQRLLSAPVTVDPDIPRRVAQVRHDIEDLYALQTAANDSLNTVNGQQRRLASRVEEVQQTLDLHGGRLDRIEDNQRQQSGRLDRIEDHLAGLSGQLAEVLTVLRGLGPSD